MSFFVSYSIRRVFYFFCFPSINIVNALIYSAFRRQTQKKAGERGVNYGSCFKVNKSSCLSTWCTHAQANLFTGKNHLLLCHASQHPSRTLHCFCNSFLFSLFSHPAFVCLGSFLDAELFWINNVKFIAESANLRAISDSCLKVGFYVFSFCLFFYRRNRSNVV